MMSQPSEVAGLKLSYLTSDGHLPSPLVTAIAGCCSAVSAFLTWVLFYIYGCHKREFKTQIQKELKSNDGQNFMRRPDTLSLDKNRNVAIECCCKS